MKTQTLPKLKQQVIPNAGTIVVVLFILFAYNAWAAPVAQDPTPGVISYQGSLVNDAGEPVSGNTDMTFRLYDAPTGGTELWSEAHTESNAVPVQDGLFRVLLGSLSPIPSIAWSNDQLYVGIQVGSGTEMTPREPLGAVPMAMTVPNGSITGKKLKVLLGEKSCDECGWPTENLDNGWHPMKGEDSNDLIEVTVTTQGGPVLVQITGRFETTPAIERWCGIDVLQQGSSLRNRPVHLDGDRTASSSDWSCSGSYLFTELPAGTYTFRAVGWMGSESSVKWTQQRQIAVFEF